ncbi:MAG: S8 family serine peptidase [Elusimicrobiota bacterium]|nr:MAG: S8 family serine peptidase [Elusimicrobiota bacterium]
MQFRRRKAILSSLAALLLWGVAAAAQSPKFDARLRSRRGAGGGGFAPLGGGGAPAGPRRPVLIRVAPGTPLAALRAAFPDAQFGSQAGDVVTARADDASLDALAADGRVASIEHAVRTRPTLDAVRSSASAAGIPVGTIYGTAASDLANATGAGVVVGIVDSGIDWNHRDFVNDGPVTSRILSIWDQTISSHVGGAFPSGFNYGAEYSNASLTAKLQGGANVINTKDTDGHGTHVAGIAAGDGTATNGAIPAGTFKGLAPSADIVAVRTTFQTDDVIDGVNYVIAKAAAAGKRAVVNLSLGTMYGPHDGTSTFESGIGALAASTPVVVAMGNDGSSNAHSLTFGSAGITVNIDAATTDADIELWHPGADHYTVTVTLTGQGGSVTRAAAGMSSGVIGGHTVEVYNSVNSGHPSGDKQLYVYVTRGAGITVPSILISLARTSFGGSGRVDGYLDPGSEGISFASPDQTMTAGEPASAPNVFAVASYASKQYWYGSDGFAYSFGNQSTLGSLSAFSSQGPTRDGRQIPEITGPGDVVASAYSADTTPAASSALVLQDLRHRILRGTSMAAPAVTGVLAARLQAGPERTVADLRTILRAQARTDGATGAVPTYTWGYGKLSASPQPVSPPRASRRRRSARAR